MPEFSFRVFAHTLRGIRKQVKHASLCHHYLSVFREVLYWIVIEESSNFPLRPWFSLRVAKDCLSRPCGTDREGYASGRVSTNCPILLV